MDKCYTDECNQEATIVVTYQPVFVRSCDECYSDLYKRFLKQKRKVNVNLGQTVDKWTKPDGSEGRLTTGKVWELEHRRISKDDGRSVYNDVTGGDPQY